MRTSLNLVTQAKRFLPRAWSNGFRADRWTGWAAIAGAVIFGGLALTPFIAAAWEQTTAGGGVTLTEVVERGREKANDGEKKAREVHALALLADGTMLLGGKVGLLREQGGRVSLDEGFPGGEVRGLAVAESGTIFAAAKDGLWTRAAGAKTWERRFSGETRAVALGTDGALWVVTKEDGVKTSVDEGRSWADVRIAFDDALVGQAAARIAKKDKMED